MSAEDILSKVNAGKSLDGWNTARQDTVTKLAALPRWSLIPVIQNGEGGGAHDDGMGSKR